MKLNLIMYLFLQPYYIQLQRERQVRKLPAGTCRTRVRRLQR